jgi:chaperonin GroEL (HSP60 family)
MGAERAFVDKRLTKLIALKKKVCDGTDKTFVVINQKGIDPICLAALAKEGVFAVRRAKRRNMERLVLACGGHALNSLEDVTVDDLGWADAVWEEELGEDHYTFIEGCKNPKSCTILIKGPADYTIAILKDAIRDGLRAVKNVFDDQGVLAGAGAFEVACHNHLLKWCDENIKGKERLGVEAFAKALLVIPQTLAMNSGFDRQDCIIKMCETERANVRKALEKGGQGQKVSTSGETPNKEEQGKKDEGWEKDNYSHKMNDGNQSINQFSGSGSIPRYTAEPVGLDLVTGDPMNPMALSIWDNYCVKKQFLNLTSILAEQLLLVDEVIKAGREMKKSF